MMSSVAGISGPSDGYDGSVYNKGSSMNENKADLCVDHDL